MKIAVFLLAVFSSFCSFSKDIKITNRSGRLVTISVDGDFYHGELSPKVIVTEVKAFDCRPCYAMEVNISSHVRDHFHGHRDVAFVSKFGRIGQLGLSAIKKVYCAVSLGGDEAIVKRILFKNPNENPANMAMIIGIDGDNYQSCLGSAKALAWQNKELSDIASCQVPYYPSVYVNGKHYSISSASQLIKIIESNL